MDSNPTLPTPTDYRDRSTGLVLFGIAALIFGGLCLMLVGTMILGQLFGPMRQAQGPAAILPGLLVYGFLAVSLIWLGIGSMLARRWARALLLIVSWAALYMGAMGLVTLGLILPGVVQGLQKSQPNIPPVAANAVMIFPLLFVFIFLILVPLVGLLFYRSPHVKATCEARDPVKRWTDRCPLPVLAVSLWLGICVPILLVMPISFRGVLPFFGVLLSGWVGSLGYLALAALWAWCAVALYRLDVRALWVTILTILLFSVSNVVTYTQHDIFEVYRLMGYPADQIEMMKSMPFLNSTTMAMWSILPMLPIVVYLLFIRHHFRGKSVEG
jgi:hypothetical protein